MKKTAAISMIVSLALLTGCSGAGTVELPASYTTDEYLGTVITITVHDAPADRKGDVPAAAEQALARVSEIHNKMSATIVGNELDRINSAAGTACKVEFEPLLELIRQSKHMSELSGGAFDVTIGPLIKLWGIGTDHPRVPDEAEIANAKRLVDFRKLEIDDAGKTVKLAEHGMSIDLGGVAKGYACDEAVRIFRENSITSAILDFGGNIYAFGKKPDGSNWNVGIREPVIGSDKIVGVVSVSDTSVVTSGGYEHYFERDGEIYHHIIDPATGYPPKSGLLSVTIISKSSTLADQLSTACFVLGVEKGCALLDSLPDTEGIFITTDNTVVTTGGIAGSFKLIESGYKLAD